MGGESANSALLLSWTSEYDSRGNNLEMTAFDPSKNKKKVFTYKYDENDNMVASTMNSYENPKEDYKQNMKYDSKKNITEIITFSETGGETRTTFTYEFDKVGNWVKQFQKGAMNMIVNRSIRYYEK